jgi:hypothetical protein
MGKRSVTPDRVRIFDTGPDVDPVTVDEQQAFYREWLRSISAGSATEAV